MEKITILGLTLLAFLLRAYRLDFQSYWIDEAWTVYFANLSLAELWGLLQYTEIMPPLYHPSTIYWIKLFGDGEYGLRFYSLIFGVMTIPFSYRLGKDLGDWRVGLLLALLMTVAPYQVWHSQEARMYSILTAASMMSMWGFVNWWQRGGWRWWGVYVVGTLWAIMVHYHGAVLIGTQGLFLLWSWRRHWRGYVAWGATLLLMLLLYLPWLIFGSDLLQGYINWIEPATLWQSLGRSLKTYSLNELVPANQAVVLTLPFVLAFILGLLYVTSRPWRKWSGGEVAGLLLAYTVAPHLAAWIYGELRTPVYLERYMIVVQGGYLLTVAYGILALIDGWPRRFAWLNRGIPVRVRPFVGVGLLLTLVSINGWVLYHHYTDPAYAKADWRAIAARITAYAQPDDAILLTGDGGELAFDFYYDGPAQVYHSFNLLPPTHPDYKQGRPNIDNIAETLQTLTRQHRRLWFTPYGVDFDPALEQWLAENSYPAWHSWVGRKRLALYYNTPPTERVERLNHPFPTAAGQTIHLAQVILPNTPIAAGDVLPLSLTWQVDQPVPADYQLSLRLINAQGDIFSQSDWPPLTPTQPTSTWPADQPILDRRSMWLPADTPPGDYLLQFVVYDPANGTPLGQPAHLAEIMIAPAQVTPPLDAVWRPNAMAEDLGPVKLVGYATPEQHQPGQAMWLWLYWQAEGQIERDTTVTLTLESDEAETNSDLTLAEAVGGLTGWQPGQVRRMVYHLPTSPHLNGETATLKLSVNGGPSTNLTTINLLNRPRTFTPPPIQYPLGQTFGTPAKISLLGYDLATPSLTPDQPLPLTLYWQSIEELSTNYTVFVQLLNDNGQVVAQIDAPPQAGAAPTSTWLPPEILADTYTLSLPNDLPPGEYQLITGLYEAATGQRLLTESDEDAVRLQVIRVE